MVRKYLLLAGVAAALSCPAWPVNAQPRVEDESWRASAAQMEARLQALLDDLRRRMEEIAASPVPGGQPGVGEIEEMIAMQRRLRLLELRQREAQILAEMTSALQRARNELAEREAPAAAPAPPVAQVQTPPEPRDVDFRILSVSGSGESLRAAVWSQRTGRINVAVGTRLPDGTVVSRVEVDGIWVRRPGADAEVPLGQADGAQLSAPGGAPIVAITPPAVPAPPPPSFPPVPSMGGGTQQGPRPASGFGLGAPVEARGEMPSPMMPSGRGGPVGPDNPASMMPGAR